jgi:lipopolysaccharide biosynthesis glycosyltransferase
MLRPAVTETPNDIWMVLASDAGYAGPLAVTLRSIDEHLSGARTVVAVILASGIGSALRARVTEGLERMEVRWHDVDIARHDGLPVPDDHLTMAAYHRLLLGDVLPANVDRAIYLDVDILARRDVAGLADVPLDDLLLGACPDVGAPRLGSRLALPTWRDLGLDPRAPCFNTGVLAIDLEQWRTTGIADEISVYLRDRARSGPSVLWADQEGFNAVASKRWSQLDLRWNAQNHLQQRDCHPDAILEPDQLAAARADPWIVHYAYAKPWQTTPEAGPWERWWWDTADRTAMSLTPPSNPSQIRRYAHGARLRLGAATAALRGHH